MRRIDLIPDTDPPQALPPTQQALDEPNGLLAAGGALTPEWLLHAYARGIFPWYSQGQPILWWAPDPRTVLFPGEFHLSRSLARTLRRARFETRVDTAFAAVVEGCAAPRRDATGTWITPAMRVAYLELHRRGFAHSVEAWREDQLCGGVYGVALGGVFFGESMFAAERDASKVALARLVEECRRRRIACIDCQVPTSHLYSLGARAIPRAAFERLLQSHVRTEPQRWGP